VNFVGIEQDPHYLAESVSRSRETLELAADADRLF
jgi:hypothetical protein